MKKTLLAFEASEGQVEFEKLGKLVTKKDAAAVFGMDMMDGKVLPQLDSVGRAVETYWAPFKGKQALTAALLKLANCTPMFLMEKRAEQGDLYPAGVAFVYMKGLPFDASVKVAMLPRV